MPQPEVIRAQTTPQDGALFTQGYANSKFVVQDHIVFAEEIRQKGVAELSNVRAGTTYAYSFEKTCTLLEDIELILTPPALAVAGGATFNRYVDDLGNALIEEITLMYGSNTITSYRMTHQFTDRLLKSDESRANIEKLVAGNLSAAARNTYALAPKPLRIRIPTPWNDMASHPLILSALANKPTLLIKFANPNAIIQTDGVKPANLTYEDVKLEFQQIHFTGEQRAEVTALQEQESGVNYLVDDVLEFNYTIPANSLRANGNPFAIELRDFDGPIHMIQFLLRTSAQLDPTSANVAPYEIDTTYLDGLGYRMTSNGMDMFDQEYQSSDGVRKTEKYFSGTRYDIQQGMMFWSEYPKMKNCDSGHLSFGNFQNPKLLLTNTKLGGVHPELVLTLIAKRHNWDNHQRGSYQKVWR